MRPQKVLEEVVNADSGAPYSAQHQKKKVFVEQLRKGLSSHAAGGGLIERQSCITRYL